MHPPSFRDRLDDILLSTCITGARPSTSVNYYYEAPNFNLIQHSKPGSRSNSIQEEA